MTFQQGDAENLPFDAEQFDVVLNVESSHTYPQMEKFLSEAHRVVQPGGHFLFADIRETRNIPFSLQIPQTPQSFLDLLRLFLRIVLFIRRNRMSFGFRFSKTNGVRLNVDVIE